MCQYNNIPKITRDKPLIVYKVLAYIKYGKALYSPFRCYEYKLNVLEKSNCNIPFYNRDIVQDGVFHAFCNKNDAKSLLDFLVNNQKDLCGKKVIGYGIFECEIPLDTKYYEGLSNVPNIAYTHLMNFLSVATTAIKVIKEVEHVSCH